MRVFIRADLVLKAAQEIQAQAVKAIPGGYVFEDVTELDTPTLDILATPKVYQRTPGGGKIRVAAVVCTQCGHENEMKDMEFEPG